MRILFTICGRAGSKGIKNKNLRIFCGKCLSYFSLSVIDLYRKKHLDTDCDIVVNSDSLDLLRQVADNSIVSVEQIARDEHLAGDSIGKIEVIKDCLLKMQHRYKANYDVVIDLDITSPLRTVRDLENVVALHVEKHADVTTTVTTARRNPYFNQVMRTDYGVKKVVSSNFTARQQAPEIFDMNASIYAYKPDFLFSGKAVLDGYCEIVEMYDTGVLDLDNENDFELMTVIAEYLLKVNTEFDEVYRNIP